MSMIVNGDPNDAIDKLQKAAALRPDTAEYQFNLGYVLRLHGDPAGALGPLQKSVELTQSKNGQYLIELATVYYRLHRPADGAKEREIVAKLTAEQQTKGPPTP